MLLLCRATRNGIHQHGMLRAAEVSQQLCRKLKRMGLNTNSSCEGDVDKVGAMMMQPFVPCRCANYAQHWL
jgi:hypothetical protein